MRGWGGGKVARAKPCRAALGLDNRGRLSRHGRGRPSPHEQIGLRSHHTLVAVGFGAGVGHVIALAVEADDEHRPPVAIAGGLVGSQDRCVSTLGRGVADALAETAVAELVGAAKEFYRIVGIVGSQYGLHSAVVLVAERQDVHPHAEASLALKTLNH